MIERKIKIKDNDELRLKIYESYDNADQVTTARWALSLARHVTKIAAPLLLDYSEVKEGFAVNELWQKGQAKVSDVRRIALAIHRYARTMDSELGKTVLRTIGHAVASGHMKEHALVASDYAIKAINILYKNDMSKVDEERRWQLNELRHSIELMTY